MFNFCALHWFKPFHLQKWWRKLKNWQNSKFVKFEKQMHRFRIAHNTPCFPNFARALFSTSFGATVIPKRNWST